MFATKPQLAGRLLQHAHDRGIRAGFVAGDEVYGGLDLRKSIRQRGTAYVMAVRSNHIVTLPSGRRLPAKTAASLVRTAMWQRMRTGSATKGAKDYHWAMIEITPDDTAEGQGDGHGFLLLRRHRYTGTVSYFLCWSPDPVPLAKLISVAVTRWKIEEDHQLTKQVSGLDSGQVTTWTSWHRWTAMSLLAYAFLAVAAACQRSLDGSAAAALGLIPVTVPELLKQLRSTVIPEPRRDKAHRDAWALWRRRHQYQAQQAHQRWHAYADEL
jgi:SRSO17 transposase